MAENPSEIAAAARLEEFFGGRIGGHLKDWRKRESFAMYAFGILGDGERKSAEPIAARASADPEQTKRVHDKLLHFLARSVWNDRAVRLEAARYAIEEVQRREPVTTWIVDDTGFLKQGSHSVGVQRQYSGSAGKISNCQIGVSLAVATQDEQIPVDFELYLPESWTEDRTRRQEARIPNDVAFKTKPQLALEMIERALHAGIPGDILLADSAYGDSADFRNIVRAYGFDFAVGIKSSTSVVRLDARDAPIGARASVQDLAARSKGKFRRITWRQGTGRTPLSSRFAFLRVKTLHEDGLALADRDPLWLIAEWREGDTAPGHFILSTLPRRMSKKEIVRILKERWRTERMYEDLKGELGLDHFEGRSFPGWHHHVSVVMCCYAFVVAERVRAFPPSTECTRDTRAIEVAA
jgi:SRSO17 transposase